MFGNHRWAQPGHQRGQTGQVFFVQGRFAAKREANAVAGDGIIFAQPGEQATHRTASQHVILGVNFEPTDAVVVARDGGGVRQFETDPDAVAG